MGDGPSSSSRVVPTSLPLTRILTSSWQSHRQLRVMAIDIPHPLLFKCASSIPADITGKISGAGHGGWCSISSLISIKNLNICRSEGSLWSCCSAMQMRLLSSDHPYNISLKLFPGQSIAATQWRCIFSSHNSGPRKTVQGRRCVFYPFVVRTTFGRWRFKSAKYYPGEWSWCTSLWWWITVLPDPTPWGQSKKDFTVCVSRCRVKQKQLT